ncbi:MAG: hypothetical protein ACFFG0_01490 [Candidatus Thorarchaeota archaeon]
MSRIVDKNIQLDKGEKIKFPNTQIYEDTTTGGLVITGIEVYIKEYIDSIKSSLNFELKFVSSDVTAKNGEVILVNSSTGNINILLTPSENGKIVIKKISLDSNKIILTVSDGGKIDNAVNKILDYPNSSYVLVSDEVNFYII